MSDMTLPDARQRFHDIAATLFAEPRAGAIRSGLAQLAAHETAAQLIARADSELIDTPHANHVPAPQAAADPRGLRVSRSATTKER